MINYFAYGSNMDKEDLDKWCEGKSFQKIKFLSVSPAKLNGFQLRFNYFSKARNGGAANIMGSSYSCVYGLLIEIDDSDLQTLRNKEGHPKFYEEIPVKVEKSDGTVVEKTMTYKVRKDREKSSDQPPTKCYMQLIIKNARKYQFPTEYITFMETIATKG
jgi:5-oxoprolinase (ATP-hydrolysing)